VVAFYPDDLGAVGQPFPQPVQSLTAGGIIDDGADKTFSFNGSYQPVGLLLPPGGRNKGEHSGEEQGKHETKRPVLIGDLAVKRHEKLYALGRDLSIMPQYLDARISAGYDLKKPR
jgi:hypothetical protein